MKRSLTVQNASVRTVVLELAKRFNTNVALPEDLRGFVTASLHDVTLEQALTAVLTPLGYQFTRKNGIVIVSRAVATMGPTTSGSRAPVVIALTYITPERAANALRSLFSEAGIRPDRSANAVIVTGSAEDVQQIRSVMQSLDVRSPLTPLVEAIQLRTTDADKVVARVKNLFPTAQFSVASQRSVLVRATAPDMTQIRQLIGSLDAPTPVTLQAGPPSSAEGVKVANARPSDVARAISRQFPRMKVGVSGSAVVFSGSSDEVSKAKALVAQIDVPAFGSRVTQIYRIRTLDAGSVGDLIARSFPAATVTTDKDLNAISVTAVVSDQQRVADAIAQLDPSQNGYAQPGGFPQQGMNQGYSGASNFEVVTLRSAVPSHGQAGAAATDAATASVIQTLQQLVPTVKVSALAQAGQIALMGDPVSLRTAKQLLDKIDVTAPLVVLDTEILEIDESAARNLGLLLAQPVISTSFTELLPQPDPTTGQTRLINPGALTRTPLSLSAQLNLQIQKGSARVLADPRVTTLSGRTATIRAGDTIGILTTVGGGAGTYATTQLQNFQTGVTLDITPIVTPGNEVTVALHPVVNSLSGILNGVPQISTRDTQTTVHLKNNQTLIIGGLIQESATRTDNKIPILGDLPLVGGIFRNSQSNSTRNELIIVVTPHVLVDGEAPPVQGPPLPAIPTPKPLPTLPPGTRLPEPSGRLPGATRATKSGASPANQIPPVAAAYPSPTPLPAPGVSGVISYGQIPPSNVAAPGDAVRIFYASVSPTILADGGTVRVALIATTNTTRASVTVGSFSTNLQQTAPGHWSASFPFSGAYALGQPAGQVSFTAYRGDGASAAVNVQVPVQQ